MKDLNKSQEASSKVSGPLDLSGLSVSLDEMVEPLSPNAVEDFRINQLNQGKGKAKDTIENKRFPEQENAMELFKIGTKLELEKKYSDAVSYYKRAIKIDPEIEYKYQSEFHKLQIAQPAKKVVEATIDIASDYVKPMVPKNTDIVQNSKLMMLPDGVLVLILRKVIAHDVDMTLVLALSCQKLSRIVQSQSIWKFMCLIAHPFESMFTLQKKLDIYGLTWHNMWLRKPRIRNDGIYISVVTYKRTGWSETLTYVQPIHFVTYYRYLRFVSNNQFIILTTPTPPNEIVKVNYN